MAEEARQVAPFERMATALLVFAGGAALMLAAGATFRLVEGWDAFVGLAQRLLL